LRLHKNFETAHTLSACRCCGFETQPATITENAVAKQPTFFQIYRFFNSFPDHAWMALAAQCARASDIDKLVLRDYGKRRPWVFEATHGARSAVAQTCSGPNLSGDLPSGARCAFMKSIRRFFRCAVCDSWFCF
jgi:hypothetical protein